MRWWWRGRKVVGVLGGEVSNHLHLLADGAAVGLLPRRRLLLVGAELLELGDRKGAQHEGRGGVGDPLEQGMAAELLFGALDRPGGLLDLLGGRLLLDGGVLGCRGWRWPR